MLYHHGGGKIEIGRHLPGGVGIHYIVVGKLFALQLAGVGDGGKKGFAFFVEGCLLMGVLAVTKILGPGELKGECLGKIRLRSIGFDPAQIVGDSAVVTGGQLEGLDGEVEICFRRHLAARPLHFLNNFIVIRRIGDHGYESVIFSRRTEHGGSADVDVFHCLFQGATGFGHRFLEAVEIYDRHVDQADVMGTQGFHMVGIVAAGQKAAVDLRMKGLEAAIHHFGEARII